ncbi:MAG TPA: DUF530 family protein [Candidatus Methanofastidiosa archaeon]|nr:DUF530 family protein [Candidatus Methanofastidiosa archaeon]
MSLISEVNSFLDNISYDFSSVSESFLGTYQSLKENYSTLKEFRSEMDFYGFRNPYFVVKGVRDSWKDPFFRQTATKKKMTFDRIQYSIAAHRIAISHFLDAAEARLEKRRLTGEKAIEMIQEGDLELSLNPDGVFNFDTLPHYPFRGEYMLLLSNLPKDERLSYRKIVGLLGQGKQSVGQVPRTPQGRRDAFGPAVPMDADLKIKRTMGPRKRVVTSARQHKVHQELIVDKYVRKCLGIGYAPLGYNVFIMDLMRYYLKKSRFERERYTSIFPGIDPDPDETVFGRYGRAIAKKEELESKLEGLKVHEKSSIVGAAAYYLVCEDRSETSDIFNIEFNKVESAIDRFKKLGLLEGKPLITDRTKKFLDYLKAEK